MSTIAQLHPSHERTLALFSRTGRKRARDIADALSIEPSAAHIRLESLRDKGILDREHKGHGWLYFRKASK